jgi:hypothetical protein
MDPFLTPPMTVLEELLLLAHDTKRDQFYPLPPPTFDCAAAGAVLMDLMLRGRIDNDLRTLFLVEPLPVNDDILDPVLQVISLAPITAPKPISTWVHQFAMEGEALRIKALRRLEKKGVLKCEAHKILWIFAADHYPLLHNSEAREIKARLREVIFKDEIPLAHDIMLTALAQACGLFRFLMDSRELDAARPRIDQVAKMDLIGQAVANAICEIETTLAMVASFR